MKRLLQSCSSSYALIATLILTACGSPAPPPAPVPPTASGTSSAPIVKPPIETVDIRPSAAPATPTVRLAALDPALENWKRTAAEKVYAVNRTHLFEGRPEHLLRAVIVVEVTVDREGRITRSKILRSPGIASLDSVALGSLKAASPLPAPPSKLVARGPLVFSETWLFRKDGRFQLRSLALPQE
jgi:protein TonB